MRKKALVGLGIVILGACWVPPLKAQRKVEVVSATQNEERRTAHHLRVSVEQLRLARKMLDHLSEVVLAADPYLPLPDVWDLPRLWQNIHPLRAKDKARMLLEHFRSRAEDRADAAGYVYSTSLSRQLLPLAFSSIEDRLEYMRNWPPRRDLAESEKILESTIAELESAKLERLIAEDPFAAREELSHFQGSGRFWTTSNLLSSFLDRGEFKAAAELAAEMIDDFEARAAVYASDLSASDLGELQSILQQAQNGLPGVAERALDIILKIITDYPDATGMGEMVLESRQGSVELAGNEAYLVEILNSVSHGSHTSKLILERVPSLAAKVNALGGLPEARQARLIRKEGGVEGDIAKPKPDLVEYAWGDAAERPEEVRRLIRRGLEDPSSGFSGLTALVLSNCRTDPEFGLLAEAEIEKELKGSKVIDLRIQYWRLLVNIYRNCEGSVPAALAEVGRSLLAQVRDAEKNAAPAIWVEVISSLPDRTESLAGEVWAVWVWTDYTEAMRELERIPDRVRQVQLMTSALSSLQVY